MVRPIGIRELVQIAFWQLVISSSYAQAEWTYLSRLSPNEGLPSSTVYAVAQDSEGILWLATESGLCSYDGVQFQLIPNPQGVSTAVDRPTLSGEGRVWCKNFSGQVFYLTNNQLIPLIAGPGERFLQLANDLEGNIWVLSNHWIYRYYSISDPPVKFSLSDFECPPSELMLNTQGAYLLCPYSLLVSDLKNPTTIRRRIPYSGGCVPGLTDQPWLLSRRTGEMWSSQDSSPLRLAKGWVPDPKRTVARIDSLRTGELSVATSTGLYLYDKGRETWEHLLPGVNVAHAFNDAEGTLWVATLYEGLIRLVRNGLKRSPVQDLFTGAQLHSLLSLTNGNLVVGLDGGRVEVLTPTLEPVLQWSLPIALPVKILSYHPETQSLFAEHLRLSYLTQTVDASFRHLTDTKDLAVSPDWCVAATFVGIEAVPLTANPAPLPYFSDSIRGIRKYFATHSARARSVTFSGDGSELYVAFETGLVYSTPFRRLQMRMPDGEPILASRLEKLGRSRVVAGTFRQGMVVLNGPLVERQLTHREGWVDLPCLATASRGDTVAYATAAGVQLYSPQTGISRLVGATDGLSDTEIRDLACTASGVWVASTTHLSFIPYREFERTAKTWQVFLTGNKLNGLDTCLGESALLPSSTYSLAFNCRTTSLLFAKGMQYSYRLLPTDTAWQKLPEGSRTVLLPQLKAGNYQLQVQARAPGVPVVVAQDASSFRIRAPLWQRWYVWLCATLLLAGVGAVFYRRRVRRLALLAQQERQLRFAQMSALRAQMNPHFLFNALNTLQDAILQADTERAAHLLQYFSKLLRHVVEYAHQQTLSLQEELKMLTLYTELQKARFAGEVTVTLEIDLPPGTDHCHVPAMFLLPFVENAFEHGLRHLRERNKCLRIQVQTVDNASLFCSIEDNGIGRTAAKELKQILHPQHNSIGLISTQERIRLYNEINSAPIKVTFTDRENPTGTRVDLTLPLSASRDSTH